MTSYPIFPSAVALPILAMTSIILCTPPLVWHARNRNIAAASLISWIVLVNFFSFINALIWYNDDTANWFSGAGLCDLEVKLLVASFVGISGSMLCIIRGLAQALDTRNALIPSASQRKRQLWFEIALCFGFPAWMMVAHFIVQPNRFAVMSVSGCAITVYPSLFTIFLIPIWPPILCIADLIFAIIVVYRIRKYRKDFAAIIAAKDPKLNKSRFIRLFALCLAMITILFPVQLYIFYRNVSGGQLYPYSWSASHTSEWGHISFLPDGGKVEFDRWIQVVFGFFVFAFFGFGRDATLMYQTWVDKTGLGSLGRRLSAASDSTVGLLSTIGSRAKLAWGSSASAPADNGYWSGTCSSRKASNAGTTLSDFSSFDHDKSTASHEMCTLDLNIISEESAQTHKNQKNPASFIQRIKPAKTKREAHDIEEGRICVKEEFVIQ